jgi:hypothetical protein
LIVEQEIPKNQTLLSDPEDQVDLSTDITLLYEWPCITPTLGEYF